MWLQQCCFGGVFFQVVEHASVCLMRIAEASATSSEKLDVLCSHGLIPQAARLISVSNTAGSLVPQTSLSTSTYTVWGCHGTPEEGVGALHLFCHCLTIVMLV
jgi:hypothetical protein